MLSELNGRQYTKRIDSGAWWDGYEATPMKIDALTKGKEKGKDRGKEKGKGEKKSKAKNTDKPKEGAPDKSSMKRFFCKEKGHVRKDCPMFTTLLAEKENSGTREESERHRGNVLDLSSGPKPGCRWSQSDTVAAEQLRELIMIDSGASVHVRPPGHGQEKSLRQMKETRPLLTASGAEMKATRHEAGELRHTSRQSHRVLDVRRPIWSLGSMMDSGCDVHFTKDRCWISKENGEELDMIRSGGVFLVAARPAKLTPKNMGMLELNPMTAAEVELSALARELAAFGTLGPASGCHIGQRWRAHSTNQSSYRPRKTLPISQLMPMVHCGASSGQVTFEGAAGSNRGDCVMDRLR